MLALSSKLVNFSSLVIKFAVYIASINYNVGPPSYKLVYYLE